MIGWAKTNWSIRPCGNCDGNGMLYCGDCERICDHDQGCLKCHCTGYRPVINKGFDAWCALSIGEEVFRTRSETFEAIHDYYG